MKVAIGCDEAAYDLKETHRASMTSKGCEGEAFGAFSKEPALYPDIAPAVAATIAPGRFEREALLGGTGIGMAITAYKTKGMSAAERHDTYFAKRARKSNDAHILSMGARVVAPELPKVNQQTFGTCEFEGGRSAANVARSKAYADVA